ncbi:RNA polymerase epsilon subunit [Pediococcus acidilactici]
MPRRENTRSLYIEADSQPEAPVRDVAYALKAVADKKSEEDAA